MTEIPTKEYLKQDIFSRRLARILRREELEWELPPDRQWIVVQRLRERAHKARRWANIMLIVLVTIGLVGAALLFIDPLNKLLFSQSGELEKITAPLKRQIDSLDTRIAAIEQEISDFLDSSYSPISRGEAADFRNSWFAVSHDDGRALAMADNKVFLYRPGVEADWQWPEVPFAADQGMVFYDARLFDDGSALIVGSFGQMLAKAPGSPEWTYHPPLDQLAEDRFNFSFLPDGTVMFVTDDATIIHRDRDLLRVHKDPTFAALRRRDVRVMTADDGLLLFLDYSEGKIFVSREIEDPSSFVANWREFDIQQTFQELAGTDQIGPGSTEGARRPDTIDQFVLSDAGNLLVIMDQGGVLELDGSTLRWRLVGFGEQRLSLSPSRYLQIVAYDEATGAAIVRAGSREDGSEPTGLFTRSADGKDFRRLSLPGRPVDPERVQVRMVTGGGAMMLERGTGRIFSRHTALGDWQHQATSLPEDAFGIALYLAENGVALLVHANALHVRESWFGPWRKESRLGGDQVSTPKFGFDAVLKPNGDMSLLFQGKLLERNGASGLWTSRSVLLPGGTAANRVGGVLESLDRIYLEPGGDVGVAIPISREFGVLARTEIQNFQQLDAAGFREFLSDSAFSTQLAPWQDRVERIDRQRDELTTRINIANLQFFNAATGQSRKEQQIAVMIDFLGKCRALKPEDGPGPTHTECLAAFEKATAPDQDTNWYRYIAERVTPALLLVFLLATMGAGYRYNLRLAALYDSRADALTLWWHRVPPEGALDGSVGELETLSEVMSSEELGFKEVRTPVDTAVDLAKSVIDKTSRMGRRTSG